jgi:hypothetical protein
LALPTISSRFLKALPLLLVCVWALVCTSCGAGKTRQKTYPVEGKVFWQNEKTPAANALVFFRPAGEPKPEEWPDGYPRGTVGADGTFKLTSQRADDGAPAGEYGVLIMWPKNAPKSDDDEAPDSEDRLDGAYNDPKAPRWRKQVKQEHNDPKDFVFIIK